MEKPRLLDQVRECGTPIDLPTRLWPNDGTAIEYIAAIPCTLRVLRATDKRQCSSRAIKEEYIVLVDVPDLPRPFATLIPDHGSRGT